MYYFLLCICLAVLLLFVLASFLLCKLSALLNHLSVFLFLAVLCSFGLRWNDKSSRVRPAEPMKAVLSCVYVASFLLSVRVSWLLCVFLSSLSSNMLLMPFNISIMSSTSWSVC